MNQRERIIWLVTSAATGVAIGLFSDRNNPSRGALVGAMAGILSGSFIAGVYEHVGSRESVPYYSDSSPLYGEIETV